MSGMRQGSSAGPAKPQCIEVVVAGGGQQGW